MEPLEATVIFTTIVNIEERFRTEYVSGYGSATVFNQVSLGWFILYEGSWEAIHVGYDKPSWKVGDKVKITMEKVDGLPR